MDLMDIRRGLMAAQTPSDSDLLHYLTRTKAVIPGGNGTKSHIDFDFNVYYVMMAGRYYFEDTSGAFGGVVDGNIVTAAGLSLSYGPAFPVRIKPSTTYAIHGSFTYSVVQVWPWAPNGDQIAGSAILTNAGDGSQFTTPNNAGIVTLVFSLADRSKQGIASNVTLTKA